MRLFTEVDCGKSSVGFRMTDKILVLGSCFADNMGQKMAASGLDVCVNPFGTLYNPVSILNSLKRLSSAAPFVPQDCVQMGAGTGLICSFHHHSSFARPTAEEFLDNANRRLKEASEFLRDCSHVVITLGTARCWRHNSGLIVSNCLKRDGREFTRETLSLEECTGLCREMAELLKGKHMIFTISPIRHLGEGAHANNISKSTLILAVDRVLKENAGMEYFPSYEILMDELRDYRFYAEDLAHPSSTAVQILWERFCEWALSPADRQQARLNEKASLRAGHRPLH